MNRYGFYTIFRLDSVTNLLYTLYNTNINGLYYPSNTAIPRGTSFGGLDLYNYMGRDVAGNWNQTPPLSSLFPPSLTIIGFY